LRVALAQMLIARFERDDCDISSKITDGLFIGVGFDVSKPRKQLHSDFATNVFDLLNVRATGAESRLQLAPRNRVEHRLGGSRQRLLQVLLRSLFIVGAQKGQQQMIYFRCFRPVHGKPTCLSEARRVAEPVSAMLRTRDEDLALPDKNSFESSRGGA